MTFIMQSLKSEDNLTFSLLFACKTCLNTKDSGIIICI